MSFKAMAWATEQEITKTSPQSHLLLILASFANDMGECYPSINTMVKKTRLSEKTVRKCLKELLELKLISDTQKSSYFGAKIYQLNLDDTPSKSTTPSKNTGGSKSTTTPLVDLPNPPSKSTTTPLVDLPPNPVIEPTNESINKPVSISTHEHTHQNPENLQNSTQPKATAKNSKSDNSKSKKSKSELTDCPDKLIYTSSQLAKCQEHNFNIDELFDDFKNWHTAKGNQFKCWSSAFSIWIKNQIRFNANKPQPTNRMDELRHMANTNPTNVFVDDLPPNFNALGVNHE